MAAEGAPPKPLRIYVLPMDVEVEGCTVTILEVVRLPLLESYQASAQVKCGDTTSNVFQVVYRDGKELRLKLETEVLKFKYALMLYGKEELRRRGVAR